MNIYELIDELTRLAAVHDNAEVKLASQPSHPLASTIAGVAVDDDGDIWILEGMNTGYAASSLWESV